MAGKSNKSKNRGRGASTTNSSKQVPSSTSKSVDSSLPLKDNSIAVESIILNEKAQVSDIGNKPLELDNSANAKSERNESTTAASTDQSKEANGDVHLYPVSVKTQSGEKLELHLNPGDSVMDLRQFLLDAPETCYLTCYDLLLHTKDGSIHHLEDYNEISEVGDITTGGCSLEMVAALYDDRSIRSHFRRARELLSFSSFHSSLSTSLALQHEMTQNKTEDSTKVEFPDLERVGFMEDVTDSLSNLVSSPSSKEIKSVESLVFSSFNPPPTYRRLVGDLIYLDVVTLEGNKHCITGSTRTFYVNSSSGSVLDPRPAKSALEATTLIGLLQKLSAKFKKGFREILDRKAAAHPFENAQFLLPANSWLGVYPVPDHKRDAGRAEDALTLSYGSELIGMQRDWNDELQSCREFSNKTLQERILRDRALYKVTCDFVDAATSGAVGVINKSIPPINPTDPECFHMYVHNNVFFSFAVDADLGQMSKNNPSIVSVKIQIDPEHNENGNSLSKSSDMFCLKENGSEPHAQNCDGSITEFHEATDVASNKSLEAQVDEQTTYASANNDLKGTKAFQEADVPGLYNLAMAIVDYRGYRVVAQSIIPGILQGDKSESLLYGSVDNGKKICWNEEFHLKVLEAAKRLHLKEHTVLDGSGNSVKLAAPVECKGIVGSDGRYYLLDLMRITPQDANYSGPSSKSCVLRPELVTAYCQVEASDRSNKTDEEVSSGSDSRNSNVDAEVHIDSISPASSSKDAIEEDHGNSGQECNSVPGKSSKLCEEILLNPNVFTEFKLADTQEEIAADEEGVRKASKYLVDVVLPKFVQDLCLLEVSPMDGRTLTEALHAHGVNVRYIGQVAEMTKHFPHIWDQCVTEIVVRSAKHIIKDVLRESLDHELGPAISHIFNCFFGNTSAVNSPSRNQKKDQSSHQFSGRSLRGSAKLNHRTSSRKDKPAAYMHTSSEGLWSDIHEFAKFKYQFELPEDVRPRVRKISAIRNMCQKVGIVISARKYDLEAAAPFQISDILNIQPVVKHSVPVCSEARDLMETGKVKLSEGKLNEAYTLFSEAFSILQQVTGPMHREVANCCRYLAMVLYHAGDMAGAIMQQHKELIINERCLGLDHPDTAHSYSNMALFYHGLNQTDLALRHMSRTLVLLSLSCGPDHPDVAATFINLAMMYQDLGKMDKSLRYLQEALKKNEQLLGPEHIQTAVCYHAMAIAFNSMQIYHKSLEHEKRTYNILVKQLGKEDPRTRESQNWINAFEMHNQVNTQKQKRQVVNAANTQQAIDMLKANQQLLQAFAAGGSGNADSSVNKSLSSTLIRDTLPRGRGVDERAARAVAEVRKKAEARGLLLRPRGGPAQALLPVAQLLNIINSGMTSEAQKDPKADKPKNEVNGTSSTEGTLTATENGSVVTEEAQAPVGLGTSLASLDSKKQKPKAKVTA